MLVALACILAVSTYRHFEYTWDEPEHLAAGLQLLDKGVYSYDIQHPPLARLAIALGPYLAGARSFGEPGPSGVQEGQDILYRTGRYEQYLTLARLGTLPFLLVLLGATWFWTRRYFGLAEATLAVLFLCSTPPLIGHAALATLDVPGAALCTLAFYALLRWFEAPSFRWALAAAITSGLAIGTKLSGLPFIAVTAAAWFLVWVAVTPGEVLKSHLKSARVLLSAVAIPLFALLTATLCYGLQFKYLVDATHPTNSALDWLAGTNGLAHNLVYALAWRVPLPVGAEELPWSIQSLLWHNNSGHLSYLLGHVSQSGWRDFYLIALGVKTPLPLLLLSLYGLAHLLWRARSNKSAQRTTHRSWFAAAPTVAFVVLLTFCSLYSHINIGVRHVFVLYPLMAIAASAGALALWRQSHHFAPRAALSALLLWQVSTLWSAYPEYLAYFNAAAGSHPESILVDSDLDWGQDLEALRGRLHQLHVGSFGFAYRGSADLKAEALPGVRVLPPFTPATGWVAASLYAKALAGNGAAFAWLDNYLPKERIGKSIDLYYIPEIHKSM